MPQGKSRIGKKRLKIWRSRYFNAMLTERLSKNVKFQQNTEQSEGVNQEAENTSRSKEKKKTVKIL